MPCVTDRGIQGGLPNPEGTSRLLIGLRARTRHLTRHLVVYSLK
jgi:hypothetical protein